MNHEIMKEKVQAFRDAELPQEERTEIEKHLPLCEECRGILKRAEALGAAMMRASADGGPSDVFVRQVMTRLARMDQPEPAPRGPVFLRWLFPALGYSFALLLMFVAIAHREPYINTESVLLADIPQNSQWAFSSEPAGVDDVME